jgi:hypothetical protein
MVKKKGNTMGEPGKQKRKVCYIHAVKDANETPYSPDRHMICLVCAAKLFELAKNHGGLEFECGGKTVSLTLLKK